MHRKLLLAVVKLGITVSCLFLPRYSWQRKAKKMAEAVDIMGGCPENANFFLLCMVERWVTDWRRRSIAFFLKWFLLGGTLFFFFVLQSADAHNHRRACMHA